VGDVLSPSHMHSPDQQHAAQGLRSMRKHVAIGTHLKVRHWRLSPVANLHPRRSTMNDLCVRDLMKRDVVTLERNESLATADDVMRLGRIRHIVVLDEEGDLAGVLSQRDLFLGGLLKALGYGTRAKSRALETLVVKEAMTAEVVTTTADTPIADAASLMLARKIGCLPVVEGKKVVGIVTESDFVAYVAKSVR
jgi:CBS domain-containing protein